MRPAGAGYRRRAKAPGPAQDCDGGARPALEGVGEIPREARDGAMETPQTDAETEPEPSAPECERSAGMDLGL